MTRRQLAVPTSRPERVRVARFGEDEASSLGMEERAMPDKGPGSKGGAKKPKGGKTDKGNGKKK